MKPLTIEWVHKAEGDLLTAQREHGAADRPNYDSACFHAQQCVEKYLKALLIENGMAFPRIHDLSVLLDLLLPLFPDWETCRERLDALSDAAVEVRYPGYSAGIEEAKEAVNTAESIRELARRSLGIV